MPRRDICDTGDDEAPDPHAPKEKEKEPETLEEALAVAAKKLRGVDSDHRKLTIAELQRALFDEDLNPFVTWLTANASTVFSALTQRLFPSISQLEVRVDGVNATRCHRDAVFMIMRASRGGFMLSRQFRDMNTQAFDVDGDRTLDYDELVYCISMCVCGVPSCLCRVRGQSSDRPASRPNSLKLEKETSHVILRWTRVASMAWRRRSTSKRRDLVPRRYEEAEKQRKQAIEDAKSVEEKERERQDAECLLMAKEDVKPEIDAALDDLGFDLLEQNVPGFDQEAADEMRREAEEEALIKWEVGTTKPCSFRDLIHTVDVDTRTAPPSTPSTRPFTTRRQDARPGRAGVVRLPLLITAADGAGLVAGSL